MSLPIRISLLCLAILAGALVAWGVMQVTPLALAAPQAQVPVAVPTSLPNQPASALPDFSSSTPGAACVLPQPGSGDCYLTWSYLYVNSDPNYVITMTVSIDGKLRASYSGFFQTSMYILQNY